MSLYHKSDEFKINRMYNNLQEEYEHNLHLKSMFCFDIELGYTIALTTKALLLKGFLEVFNFFKTNGYTNIDETKKTYLLIILYKIRKRIIIHITQLKKLNNENTNDNKEYYNMLLRICYSYLLKGGVSSPHDDKQNAV
jgi:hypothetical protein